MPNKVGRPVIDILGKKFGRLLVIRKKGLYKDHMVWICKCDCGNKKEATGENLRSGKIKSCGCFQREVENNPAFVHGQCVRTNRTKEYSAYQSAKTRCTNPKVICFPEYGGRGIKFLFTSFEQFFNELGKAPSPKHSVDRIDHDGNYEPGNVRWATPKEQIKNRRKFRAITGFSTEELEAELNRRKLNA